MSVMPAKQIALFVCQIFFKNFLTIINKLQKKNKQKKHQYTFITNKNDHLSLFWSDC